MCSIYEMSRHGQDRVRINSQRFPNFSRIRKPPEKLHECREQNERLCMEQRSLYQRASAPEVSVDIDVQQNPALQDIGTQTSALQMKDVGVQTQMLIPDVEPDNAPLGIDSDGVDSLQEPAVRFGLIRAICGIAIRHLQDSDLAGSTRLSELLYRNIVVGVSIYI